MLILLLDLSSTPPCISRLAVHVKITMWHNRELGHPLVGKLAVLPPILAVSLLKQARYWTPNCPEGMAISEWACVNGSRWAGGTRWWCLPLVYERVRTRQVLEVIFPPPLDSPFSIILNHYCVPHFHVIEKQNNPDVCVFFPLPPISMTQMEKIFSVSVLADTLPKPTLVRLLRVK